MSIPCGNVARKFAIDVYEPVFAVKRARRIALNERQVCVRLLKRWMTTKRWTRVVSADTWTENSLRPTCLSRTNGLTLTTCSALGTFCHTARYAVMRRGFTCTRQTPFSVVVRATCRNSEVPNGRASMLTTSPSAPALEIEPWSRTARKICTVLALCCIWTARTEATSTAPRWFVLKAPWYVYVPPLTKVCDQLSPGFSTGDLNELSSATIWRSTASLFFQVTVSPFSIEISGGKPVGAIEAVDLPPLPGAAAARPGIPLRSPALPRRGRGRARAVTRAFASVGVPLCRSWSVELLTCSTPLLSRQKPLQRRIYSPFTS